MRATNDTNCCGSGRSSAKLRVTAACVSRVAKSPASAAAGPPGTDCTSANNSAWISSQASRPDTTARTADAMAAMPGLQGRIQARSATCPDHGCQPCVRVRHAVITTVSVSHQYGRSAATIFWISA